MKLNNDFSYCNGRKLKQCTSCKRKLDKKYKDAVVWRVITHGNPCQEYVKKD